MSDDTESTESTALAKTNDLEARISLAVEGLNELSTSLENEDLADKVLELAQLTQPGIKGMEGDERVRIPQVFIRQPSSSSDVIPDDCKIGHLYDSNGNNLGDSLTFIPILVHTVRKKWGEEQIDCQSLDGVTGTRYGACSECPYGRFEKGVRPDCSRGHSFFGVTEDLSALYNIQFLKSSAKAGRNIKRLVGPPALWGKSFTVTTEKISTNNRNYYEYRTSPSGRNTDDETMEICDKLHEFYQARYYLALHNQALFAQRLKEGAAGGTPAGEAVEISDDSEVIDFADSM